MYNRVKYKLHICHALDSQYENQPSPGLPRTPEQIALFSVGCWFPKVHIREAVAGAVGSPFSVAALLLLGLPPFP